MSLKGPNPPDERAAFAALVSHELRSPLTAVVAAARTLKERWPELAADQRDRLLELIATESMRASALVREAFDPSRADTASFAYALVEVDPGAIVADAATASELGLARPVAVEIDADLPPVRADPDRLRQVLANLLENAVKYSPAGSPVAVRACREGERIVITVSDRGPGIEPADRELIFERFGRARGTSSQPGTGLGLHIARTIAVAHGGTLELTSTTSEGSTFTLALPV